MSCHKHELTYNKIHVVRLSKSCKAVMCNLWPADCIQAADHIILACGSDFLGCESTNSFLKKTGSCHIRGLYEKYVDSPYYSKSELCGGMVTVSFLKYLPWQGVHFLQHSTHFSKTCCRPLITSEFLALELPFRGWKSPEITQGEIWTVWHVS
jgi:hypothetical protein